jgi:hypothetical protein
VNGFHIESVAQDKRDRFAGAEVREPVSGKDTFDRDDQILTIGGNGLEKRLRTGFHVAMEQELAVLAEDTYVHAASMQINATIRFVLLGVKSHEVSSSAW